MKPLIVDMVVTVNVALRVYEEDPLVDGYDTLEDAVKGVLGTLLDRRSDPYGELDISVESVDSCKVRDYGDFAELAECPCCKTVYALRADAEYIEEHGACLGCPDPKLEELE